MQRFSAHQVTTRSNNPCASGLALWMVRSTFGTCSYPPSGLAFIMYRRLGQPGVTDITGADFSTPLCCNRSLPDRAPGRSYTSCQIRPSDLSALAQDAPSHPRGKVPELQQQTRASSPPDRRREQCAPDPLAEPSKAIPDNRKSARQARHRELNQDYWMLPWAHLPSQSTIGPSQCGYRTPDSILRSPEADAARMVRQPRDSRS